MTQDEMIEEITVKVLADWPSGWVRPATGERFSPSSRRHGGVFRGPPAGGRSHPGWVRAPAGFFASRETAPILDDSSGKWMVSSH